MRVGRHPGVASPIAIAALILCASIALRSAADEPPRRARHRPTSTHKQSARKADVELTGRIRETIVKDAALSNRAQNVEIVTSNGAVILRGRVPTSEEKATLAAKTQAVPGVMTVDNQLDVSGR